MDIYTSKIETPIGTMLAVSNEEGICQLIFTEIDVQPEKIKKQFKINSINLKEGTIQPLEILTQQLSEYFEGKRKEFSVPLSLCGTKFQLTVWEELQKIPFGEIRSYQQQSLLLNNLLAIRAVANANSRNPIAIVIPCHRVIGENGKLTGYAGGLWRKKWLLQHEIKYEEFKMKNG